MIFNKIIHTWYKTVVRDNGAIAVLEMSAEADAATINLSLFLSREDGEEELWEE